VRLYLETSTLGALADREDPERPALTRQLLRGVVDGVHEGVISNVVQEELGRAPAEVRKVLLTAMQQTQLELVVEDEESRSIQAMGEAVLPARAYPSACWPHPSSGRDQDKTASGPQKDEVP
jgi:hypothetical protein